MFLDDHPAGLALVGDDGDHGEFLACAAHCQGHGCFSCQCIASAAYVCVSQGRLVTPVDFGTFVLGALLDTGVLALQPSLHSLRVLFEGALDGALRGEAQAGEVFAYAAHLQLDAVFLVDMLAHRCTAPQEEVHHELFGMLVDDDALNGVFLGWAQYPSVSPGASTA